MELRMMFTVSRPAVFRPPAILTNVTPLVVRVGSLVPGRLLTSRIN